MESLALHKEAQMNSLKNGFCGELHNICNTRFSGRTELSGGNH
jgi:hypothetical protein